MTALLGHQKQERAVVDAFCSRRMPHAWLLTGPEGIGKAAFARKAGLYILASEDISLRSDSPFTIPVDHPAAKLVEAGAHPEFLWVKREATKSGVDSGKAIDANLARSITVDQVRILIGRLRNRPGVSPWRTVIIDSVDDLERSAANALLKTIEEPPQQTVFFLVSHNPGRLLPTIRSRCRALPFTPLTDEQMAELLAGEMPDADPSTIAALVVIGRGSPGRALRFADQSAGQVAGMLNRIADEGDSDNAMASSIAKQLGSVADKQQFESMIAQASSIAGHRSRSASLKTLGSALDVHESVTRIGRTAVSGSEDAASVCIAISGALAGLGKR
jgi:DNA polymerase III subunit delta'